MIGGGLPPVSEMGWVGPESPFLTSIRNFPTFQRGSPVGPAEGDSDFRLAKGESGPSLAAPFFFLWQTVGAPVSVRIFIGAIAGRKTKPTTNP